MNSVHVPENESILQHSLRLAGGRDRERAKSGV